MSVVVLMQNQTLFIRCRQRKFFFFII